MPSPCGGKSDGGILQAADRRCRCDSPNREFCAAVGRSASSGRKGTCGGQSHVSFAGTRTYVGLLAPRTPGILRSLSFLTHSLSVREAIRVPDDPVLQLSRPVRSP